MRNGTINNIFRIGYVGFVSLPESTVIRPSMFSSINRTPLKCSDASTPFVMANQNYSKSVHTFILDDSRPFKTLTTTDKTLVRLKLI